MERFKVLHAEEYMFIPGLRPVRESVTLATGEAEARGLRMQTCLDYRTSSRPACADQRPSSQTQRELGL